MRQYTTGKLYLGVDIPDGGLRQDMLNDSISIEDTDILCAAGNQHDKTTCEISRFFIAKAIEKAYPKSVHHVFDLKRTDMELDSSRDYSLPKMPEIDILPPEVTPTTTLGPITAEEGSIERNYQVLDDIFLRQLGLDQDKDFIERLILIFGDQLTVSRLRSIQTERKRARLPYNRHNWLLQVPSFFHVRMNLLWLINHSHYGDPDACVNVYSALSTHAQVLNRKKMPKNAPFEHLEDIAIHSFYARIVALFHARAKEISPSCDIHDPEEVDNYIRSLHPDQFLTLVEDIRNIAFTKDIRKLANHFEKKSAGRKSKRKPNSTSEGAQSAPKIDEEFINHVRFLQAMETYCTLKYATQHGDVGLIMRLIPRLCIYFNGGPAKNYAREMLYLFRLVSTDAYTPTLRRAILKNGLINKRGKPNSWMPIDLHVELLNLELKLIINARRNGTFGADELFKDCILLCDYASSLRKAFEIHLSSPISGEHTPKDSKKDIRYLADLILVEGSISQTTSRSCPHKSLNLLGEGVNALSSGAVSRFNDQLSNSQLPDPHADGNDHDNPGNDAEAIEACSNNQYDTASDIPSNIEEDDSDRDIPRAEAHLYTLLVLFPLDLLNGLYINLFL